MEHHTILNQKNGLVHHQCAEDKNMNTQQAHQRIAECVRESQKLLEEAFALSKEHGIYFEINVEDLITFSHDPNGDFETSDWQASESCW